MLGTPRASDVPGCKAGAWVHLGLVMSCFTGHGSFAQGSELEEKGEEKKIIIA